jgi:hypothetical protein
MRAHPLLLAALFTSVVIGQGCAAPTGGDVLASKSDAIQLATGTIPYPAKTSGGYPLYDDSGRLIPGWNGTVVDLMAADAWAQCGAHAASAAGSDRAHDAYTEYLESRMSWASCSLTGGTGSEGFVVRDCTETSCIAPMKRWAVQRQVPWCNGDPSTGYGRALAFQGNGSVGHTVPSTASLGLPAASPLDVNVVAQAQKSLDIAEVNLCMAQRLREHMNTADSLILNGADQRQLLEVIRQRAQLSMLQYALIGRAMSNPDGRTSGISHEKQTIQVFQAWGASASSYPTQLTEIGRDFAAAIALHVSTTRDLAELLTRSAAARASRGGTPRSAGEELWGAGSWRQRVLSLLYGGNPLRSDRGELDLATTPSPIPLDSWTDRATVPWNTDWIGADDNDWWPNSTPGSPRASYVETSLREPEIHTLLGLARNADALFLKQKSGDVSLLYLGRTIPFPRTVVDEAESGDKIFLATEASLRRAECLAKTPTLPCAIAINDPSVPSLANYEQSLLWMRYRIKPTHARTLARVLAEAVPHAELRESEALLSLVPYGSTPGAPELVEGALHATGANKTLTSTELTARLPGATGTWMLLYKDSELVPATLAERAGAFAEGHGHSLPHTFDKYNLAELQGFVPEKLRRMGAATALVATRDLIVDGTSTASSGLTSSFFVEATKTSDLIGAVVGKTAVTIRPALSAREIYDSCDAWGSWPCWVPIQESNVTGTTADWIVSITMAGDDPLALDETVTLVSVPAGKLEVTASLDPTFTAFDAKSRSAFLETGAVTATSLGKVVSSDGKLVRRDYRMSLPTALEPDWPALLRTKNQSLFLKQPNGSSPANYKLVAARVAFETSGAKHWVSWSSQAPVFLPTTGHYFAFGGTLGGIAANAWSARALDWSRPAYDGFGRPTDWLPSSDPALFGGLPGEDPTSFYLRASRSAADEATSAVKLAMDELLKQQADDASLAAARKKGSELEKLEERALCGEKNPKCDVEMLPQTSGSDLPAITCVGDLCDRLREARKRVIPPWIMLARPVVEARHATSAPSFGEYAGGSIQRALIDQWSALRALRHSVEQSAAAIAAREEDVKTAHAAVQAAGSAVGWNCAKETLNRAYDAGFSYGAGAHVSLSVSEDEGIATGWGYQVKFLSGSRGWSAGSLVAQWNACKEAERMLPTTVQQKAAVVAEGYAWLANQTTALSEAGTNLQRATAELYRLRGDSKLAKARVALESDLAQASLLTKLGSYRRYHSYDVWRARALLENARRYGLAARRAIESRVVVDLSELHASEPFVAAPSTWADEVFQYDLDAPAAVGLSATSKGADGVYPNRLADYVGNLERFYQGYAIARPTATARNDSEVVSIVGPDVRVSSTSTTVRGDSYAWQFQCAGSTTWFSHPMLTGSTTELKASCAGASPARARVTFRLDPWGRLNGDIAREPYSKRHNVRWTRLAVNLVGTGIRDCSGATDPLTCYSESFVRYNMSQVGPAWVTNAEGQWRDYELATARIESGKALAAEQWLDPVMNSWFKPHIDSIARYELLLRPMGGVYQIEIATPPDVRLDRIERVQILTQADYWVKQD